MAKPSAKTASARRQASLKADTSNPVKPTPLNFKVPADFRREFKTYAAQHRFEPASL